ncbi:nickel pincer cofactor biosynthesis protein LarB [Bacillus sp. Marseille-Q3570]|uniref:nickel pincer cofactor biosynthesis protein LarB n=1 Tax=Bacillus sp. Marseille-Q3570 TaxID=2963522 RepID=UPI0021B7810E|nr:nickel pincer cofactor biosynthesis protein LarB [Bacillus sp. Marseille-Q3570]
MKDTEGLLQKVQNKEISISEAKGQLEGVKDLKFATLDLGREKRTGFPEVVYGEGKSSEQILRILERLQLTSKRVLATRVDVQKAEEILSILPHYSYNSEARTLYWKHESEHDYNFEGYIAVVSAGTSDLPVAEEAAITAEAMGCRVKRVNDVGVAGIHRLFDQLPVLENASAIVVVAGMEGALGSVVAGLVKNPVIAVPTSIGYGANFQGLSALLSMLNACAPGISTVNIDNGYGGGYNAALIASLINRKETVES